LTQVRRGVPDAGGLVIASNQTQARAHAKNLHRISGERPLVVLSDYAGSSGKIEEFAQGNQRWMVAVRMVSEGVDVPRLCVGVYATSTSTLLYFAQAVGRFVRAPRRGETASIFLLSVPRILEHAAHLEDERDHALDRVDRRSGGVVLGGVGVRGRVRPCALRRQQFGLNAEVGSADEQEFLGLPGLFELDQVATLRTPSCTPTCAGAVAGRRWTRQMLLRSPGGSRSSAAGLSALAEPGNIRLWRLFLDGSGRGQLVAR
jgi:hypothetical protein